MSLKLKVLMVRISSMPTNLYPVEEGVVFSSRISQMKNIILYPIFCVCLLLVLKVRKGHYVAGTKRGHFARSVFVEKKKNVYSA